LCHQKAVGKNFEKLGRNTVLPSSKNAAAVSINKDIISKMKEYTSPKQSTYIINNNNNIQE